MTNTTFSRSSSWSTMLSIFEAGVDWIIHLDIDKLMHPAGSLELESSVERDDVKEPLSEVRYLFTVSMFKKNYDHLTKEMYFGNYKEATHGNPNYFLTYENGKSAARVQDHLRPNGAHRWHNYMKSPKHACFACYLFLFYFYFVSYLFPVLQKVFCVVPSMLVLVSSVEEMEVIKFEGSPQVNLISLKWKWIVKSF
ncbi:hypothetical protein MTR67_023263 [Solanum verrucosum]|uniref:Glycosyltransferase family 92 protein n=1 Tax=Solanum verrucosum TaxID=315347 RepID=A0AAF0QV49_SOLVR|nr:hypothetical protein MTR67_023263 [Solanum verrucosum]